MDFVIGIIMKKEKIYKFIFVPIVSGFLYYLFIIKRIPPYDLVGTLSTPYGSALILLLLGHIFLENIFTKPKDSLANAVNALLILVIIFLQPTVNEINIWIILIIALIALFSSLLYLLVYEGKRKFLFLQTFSSKLGRAAFIFPLTAFLYFVKIESNNEFLIKIDRNILFNLFLFLLIFLSISSYKSRTLIINNIFLFWNFFHTESVGRVIGFQIPNIVLAEFEEKNIIELKDLVFISNTNIKDNKITEKQENYLGIILDFIESNIEKKISVRIFLFNEPQKNIDKELNFSIKTDTE